MDAKERKGFEEKSFKAAVITVSDKGSLITHRNNSCLK